MRYIMSALAMVLALVMILASFLQAEDRAGMSFEGLRFDVLPVITTAGTLILGIVFGCLFRRMGGPDREISIGAELKSVCRSSSFIASLCVSPFVYFAVYAIVRGSPGEPASYLLAFQNGFFCQAIFNRMFDGDGRSRTPTAGS